MNTEEAVLAAVFDTKRESAVKLTETYGGDVCDTLEELLAREDVEVVCICTPSGMHAEQTAMVARAGKHVLVEKPMAIKLDDVERMIEVCAESGVARHRLSEAHVPAGRVCPPGHSRRTPREAQFMLGVCHALPRSSLL